MYKIYEPYVKRERLFEKIILEDPEEEVVFVEAGSKLICWN
jgi:hypothetical protein